MAIAEPAHESLETDQEEDDRDGAVREHYIFSSPNARPHRASAGEPLAWWSRVLGWLIGSGGGSNDGAMNMSSRTHVTDRWGRALGEEKM
jgi:hypothetical protein